MKYLFLRLLPKNLVSRLVGLLSDIRFPRPFLRTVIYLYCRFYDVRLEEMKLSLEEMENFNAFFVRELKPGSRPIDQNPKSVISPVDGTISEFGNIENGLLVQTKGVLYSLADLVGKKDAVLYDKGYFVTIYLCPADYHRIHTPIAGKVNRFSYFSGNLWPVNNLGVQNVGGLFALNERIITPIEGVKGTVALIKVGATVVGRIKVNFNDLSSNSGKKTQLQLPVIPAKQYKKGDEIGRFELGSTVILLFEKDRFTPEDLYNGKKIQLGQVIGYL